jgi:hypothetical protein
MPEPAIEQLHASPAFASLVALAQTTVYDNRLVASVSTPTVAMLGVAVPTTSSRGPDRAVNRHRRRATRCCDAGDGSWSCRSHTTMASTPPGPFERFAPESADQQGLHRRVGRRTHAAVNGMP